MKVDWQPVRDELAIWRAEGLTLPLWWRDDDAVQPTAALDKLLDLSDKICLPIHLAVIPQRATQPLADRLAGVLGAVPVVHGWAHHNWAPAGAKKAEFGHPRAGAVQEAQDALARMRGLFGDNLLEMFVPPWNRIAPEIMVELQALGYRALSTYTPRTAREAAPGLVQINTHMDPIFWRGGGGLRDPEAQITALVSLLQARRAGATDAAEPLGFLTHHLVHDAAIWRFTEACLAELREGGAVACNLLDRKESFP